MGPLRASSIVIVILVVAASGCIFKDAKHTDVVAGYGAAIHAAPGDPAHGASAHVMGGVGGIHFVANAEVMEGERTDDPRIERGGGLGAALRASPLGIFGHHHALERWLDGGFEVGGTAGAVAATSRRINGYGYGYTGAWVELGLVSVGDGYLSATGSLRWVATETPWIARDQIVIGLAWRTRGPVTRR